VNINNNNNNECKTIGWYIVSAESSSIAWQIAVHAKKCGSKLLVFGIL
jgi:hypothetical protein